MRARAKCSQNTGKQHWWCRRSKDYFLRIKSEITQRIQDSVCGHADTACTRSQQATARTWMIFSTLFESGSCGLICNLFILNSSFRYKQCVMVWYTDVLPLCAWARDGKYPCLRMCTIAPVPLSFGVNVKISSVSVDATHWLFHEKNLREHRAYRWQKEKEKSHKRLQREEDTSQILQNNVLPSTFLLWFGTMQELHQLQSFINSIHPTISFIPQSSPLQLPLICIVCELLSTGCFQI